MTALVGSGWQVGPGWGVGIAFAPTTGLWSWGRNAYGELGLGDLTNRSSPTQVGTSTSWASLATDSSTFFRAMVQSNGTLWVCGYNQYGQLGLGDTTSRLTPVQVGSLSNWAQVSCAQSSLLAIKTDGTLWACGYNGYGQLGLNTTTSSYSSPVQVGTLSNWSTISCGIFHATAVKTNGTLWTWGYNIYGQLGQNNTAGTLSSPVQVGALTSWLKSSGTGYATFALKNDNTFWSCGYGSQGQLGNNSTSSFSSLIQIGSASNWSQISSGFSNTLLAIQSNGTLWSWGFNIEGQLGNNSTSNSSTPTQVGTASTWTQVSAGYYHSVGLRSDGTLWSWGSNTYGQQGTNSSTPRNLTPVQIGTSSNWVSIVAGGYSTAALQYIYS